MVVRSGEESIVRIDRGIISFYYVLAWVFMFPSVFFWWNWLRLFFSWREWADHIPWVGLIAGLILALWLSTMGLKLLKAARRRSQVYVAIGPGGVRLRLMQAPVDLGIPITGTPQYQVVFIPVPKLLPEEYFGWNEIGGLQKNEDGTFLFHARDRAYVLRDGNCPPPFVVAQLLAERLGVELPQTRAEIKAAKRMPRRKLAKILAGIGLVLLIPSAAGSILLFAGSQQGNLPDAFVFVFIALLAIGTGGGLLLLTAIFVLWLSPRM